MLIDTITFEIVNVKLNIRDEFLIENTVANQEKVFTHPYTRNIQIGTTFQDFDFAKKEHMPVSFYEIADGIDPVDEMVGTF